MKAADTTLLFDLLKGKEPAFAAVKRSKDLGGLATTEVNTYEVVRGIQRKKPERAREAILKFESLLQRMTVFAVDRKSAMRSGAIWADLSAKGIEVEHFDVLIGGTCLANGVTTIITENKRHFERIPGLKVETY
jgi:predicted nucleic acid-binding protein